MAACLEMEVKHYRTTTKHKTPCRQALEDLCVVLLEERDKAMLEAEATGDQETMAEASLPVQHKKPPTADRPKYWVQIGDATELFDWEGRGMTGSPALPQCDVGKHGRTQAEVDDTMKVALVKVATKITRDMRLLFGPRGSHTVQGMPVVAGHPACMGVLLRPLYMNHQVVLTGAEASGSSGPPQQVTKQVYQCMKHSGKNLNKKVFWAHPQGYLRVKIAPGRGNWELAHRIICWEFHGPPGDKEEVLHICGNNGCMNPQHMKWGTHPDNCNMGPQVVFVEKEPM